MNDPRNFGGVGLVETQHLQLSLPPEGFRLECGGTLPSIEVAYETYGTLAPDASNAVFICHALTGDAHAAGYTPDDVKKPSGWWDNMIGPGRGIDTNQFFVICANILGGCKGTTGPSSINPADGKPYGSRFPDMTVADIVDVHALFLSQLGIERLAAIIGGSFGGMQALLFAIRHPTRTARVACIASGASLSTQALAFDIVGRAAVVNDPAWQGGDYYESNSAPVAGLAQARQLAHITYLSESLLSEKFGRRTRTNLEEASLRWAEAAHSPFEIESYLDHQGEKFIRRFDANSYLCIMRAMDRFDLSAIEPDPNSTLSPLAQSLSRIQCPTLVVSLSGDWLFTTEQSETIAKALLEAGRPVSLAPLPAPAGHDAFLTHIGDLQHFLSAFLASAGSSPVPVRNHSHLVETDHLLQLIPDSAHRVLDLGCDNGAMLDAVRDHHPNCSTTGLDRRLDGAIATLSHGHDVLVANIDRGLPIIPDNRFDCVLLSETLQVMRHPDQTLREMLRIAPVGVVTFPNFGHWRVIRNLFFSGRMPKSKRLPFEWYDTPNIHLCTLRDFRDLCAAQGAVIEKLEYFCSSPFSKFLLRLGFRNLGASRILARIRRG